MKKPTDKPPDPTDEELAFTFASGRLALALVMTVGERKARSYERLRDPGDLARWVVAAGLLDREPPVSERQLLDARVLRESIHGLVRAAMAGEGFAVADLEVLNSWAARPDVAPRLDEDGTVDGQPGRSPIDACLGSVARDAVRLLGEEDPSRLRECEGGCGLLFFDSSRPGNRRWCADGACGSRARVAAHRRRDG